jgi:O-acetylhomoserine (thiol)-lyase
MEKETLAIHSGYIKDAQGTMAVPIYQTTAYQFKDIEHAGNLFSLKELGNIYTRLNNPTTDVFEKRVASLENGAGALATASGMSAITYSIMNVAESGDNIIASSKLYGGSLTLLTHTLKRFGIEARFFDIEHPAHIEKLIDENTKGIFFESLSNPTTTVADIDAISEIANRYNIITIVDNTVASPMLCNPIDFGVDIVVHSASKYITGQGLAIGGAIIERENLVEKIKENPRYPQFNTPDVSYHGLVYVDTGLPLFTLRARLLFLRDMGAALAPFNSWLFIQGLETLPLRMKQHSESALQVAEFLENHPKVKLVNYPKLDSSKYRVLADKYLENGASGLMSFDVGSYEDATKIVNSVEIFTLVANIGDSKSIITHPASTTHQQLSDSEMVEAGVSKGLIRLSIGLENANDLINDLKQALEN